MTLTIEELKEKMVEQLDEVMICELLHLTPEDLVEAFTERVENNYNRLMKEIE